MIFRGGSELPGSFNGSARWRSFPTTSSSSSELNFYAIPGVQVRRVHARQLPAEEQNQLWSPSVFTVPRVREREQRGDSSRCLDCSFESFVKTAAAAALPRKFLSRASGLKKCSGGGGCTSGFGISSLRGRGEDWTGVTSF